MGFFLSQKSGARIIPGYLSELPRRGGSNEYHNLCFGAEIRTRAVVGQRARLLGTFYIVTFLSLSHII